MKFRINGLEFGGDSKYKVLAPVMGLDSASIRTAAGDFSGRDGGYVSAQYYGSRTIVINGFYRGTSCEDADNLREELAKALKIRVLTPVYITTFSNKHKWYACIIIYQGKNILLFLKAKCFYLDI